MENVSEILMANTTEPASIEEVSEYFLYSPFSEILNEFSPTAIILDKVITPIWYCLGILGNSFSFYIWMDSRMRKSNSSAYYLAALSLSDLLLLLLHIVIELRYAWGVTVLNTPGLCESYMVVYLIPHYLSALLVLGFTTERYIAVCHPFQKETFCTKSRALITICGLFAFSVAVCCVQGYFWEYNEEQNSCEVRDSVGAGLAGSVWSIWTWTTEMVFFALVPVSILILNIFVVTEVCRVSQYPLSVNQSGSASGNTTATTAMLLTVSFYMIFTLLPATVVYSMSGIYADMDYSLNEDQVRTNPTWQSYFTYYTVRKCVEELSISHYACNFFIYVTTGKQFRKKVKQTLKPLTKVRAICNLADYKEISVNNGSKRNSFSSQTKITKV